MNNNWNRQISAILGSFWSRIFGEQNILTWFKSVMSEYKDTVERVYDRARSSRNLFDDSFISPDFYTVVIPVDMCAQSINKISSYAINNTNQVRQHTEYSSVSIPIEFIHNPCTIQDAVDNPTNVWVDGVNSIRDDQYVTLFFDDNYRIPVIADTDGSVITPSYKLYVKESTSDVPYKDTFGILIGVSPSNASVQTWKSLWDIYTRGPRESIILDLAASATSCSIAQDSGTIQDIWTEHGTQHILTSTNRLYSGKGVATKCVGEQYSIGSTLFNNITELSRYNVPESISHFIFNSEYGPLIAYNKELPTIATDIGPVPDMGNTKWVDAVVKVGESNAEFRLLPNDATMCNPLQYALTYMIPGTGPKIIVQDDTITKPDIIGAINEIVVNGSSMSNTGIVSVSQKDGYVYPVSISNINPQAGIIQSLDILDIKSVNISVICASV